MNRTNVTTTITNDINTMVTSGDIAASLRPNAKDDLIRDIVSLIQSAENSGKTHAADLVKHNAVITVKK